MTRTPEEIKKGLECCAKGNSCRGHCPYDGRSAGIKECTSQLARDALALIPRWISVKERLPEEGELVVFIPTINQGSIYVGKLSHTGARGGVLFENRQGRTTMKYYAKYWMPLPEPPEVNEK